MLSRGKSFLSPNRLAIYTLPLASASIIVEAYASLGVIIKYLSWGGWRLFNFQIKFDTPTYNSKISLELHGFSLGLHGFSLGLHGFSLGLHGFSLGLHGFSLGLHGFSLGLHGFSLGLHGVSLGLHSFFV